MKTEPLESRIEPFINDRKLGFTVNSADQLDARAMHGIVAANAGLPSWRILDTGPQAMEGFKKSLQSTRIVVGNDLIGVFEMTPFVKEVRDVFYLERGVAVSG